MEMISNIGLMKEINNCRIRLQKLEKKLDGTPAELTAERRQIEKRIKLETEKMKDLLRSISGAVPAEVEYK